MNKTCSRCGKSLPLSEYYKFCGRVHGAKCKSCVRAAVEARRVRLMNTDPVWRESELQRQREKSALARINGTASKSNNMAKYLYARRHPVKRAAHIATHNAIRDQRLCRKPCQKCGHIPAEAHHEDYTKPMDVVWLCKRHHMERHVEMNKAKRAAKYGAANLG